MFIAVVVVGDQFGAAGFDGQNAIEAITFAINEIAALQGLAGFHYLADVADFALRQAAWQADVIEAAVFAANRVLTHVVMLGYVLDNSE